MEIDQSLETDLLRRSRSFDKQALAQIYDAYSPGLYRYAMRLLNDQNQAEDCVAETFSRFLQALQGKRGPATFLKAYLYRIAHNWISDAYRRVSPPEEELPEEQQGETASPEEESIRHQRQERLRSAIRQLTPEQQQVVMLKYLEGWDNEEIAHSLKKPVGAVKSMLHRAVAALQRILQKEDMV